MLLLSVLHTKVKSRSHRHAGGNESSPAVCSSVHSSGPGGPQRAGGEQRGEQQGAEEEPSEEEGQLEESATPSQTRGDGADPGAGGTPARQSQNT